MCTYHISVVTSTWLCHCNYVFLLWKNSYRTPKKKNSLYIYIHILLKICHSRRHYMITYMILYYHNHHHHHYHYHYTQIAHSILLRLLEVRKCLVFQMVWSTIGVQQSITWRSPWPGKIPPNRHLSFLDSRNALAAFTISAV